jgi:hypothetical protein
MKSAIPLAALIDSINDAEWWPQSTFSLDRFRRFADRNFPVNSLFLASPQGLL